MVGSRKMLEGIYGGHQPRDVAAAVALGILAGTMAGGNLSWVAVLLAAILFNVHTRLFLAAWLASLLLAWLSRGSLEDFGRFLLDGTPLGSAIGVLGDGILVALLGWDEYALVGGLAAGTAAAVACAPIAYWTTCRLRRRWLQTGTDLPAEAGRDEGPHRKDGPLTQAWHGRVWYGPSSREQQVRRAMAPRRLRSCGVPATLAAAATLAAVSWSLARLSAERALWRELSVYNGAQVSCAHTELSLWSGEFLLRDLAIADAARPERDRLRIGIAKGRLSPGLLLRGRLNIERVVLRQIQADAAREQPAQRYNSRDVAPTSGDRSLHVYSPSAGDLEVSPYLCAWGSVCRRLSTLQQLVAAIERLPSAERVCGASPGHRRSDLGRRQPRVAVQELRVDGLPRAWSLGNKALVNIVNLSSNPPPASKPARVEILLPKFGAELRLDFASDTGRPHAVCCSACDLDLGPALDGPLAVSGRARLTGQGSFDRDRFELRALVEVESLAAEVTCAAPLIGVEPELWNRGFKQLASCNAQMVCFGPWTSPGLVTDGAWLVEQVVRRLQGAGQQELVATMEQRMARHIERQAGLQEQDLATPTVVQATAIEVQSAGIEPQATGVERQRAASQPGRRELAAEDAASQAAYGGGPPQSPGQDASSSSNFIYPTTSVPYEDAEYASPPSSVAYDDYDDAESPVVAARPFTPPVGTSPVGQRPLPGPMQMSVGRDLNAGPPADFGAEPQPAPRESRLSRWTSGLRQKFAQVFARPKEASEDPPEWAEPAPPVDDRAVPAAASETWYNRRWR